MSSLNPSPEAIQGFQALRQGNYTQAISLLVQASQQPVEPEVLDQIQMGLVIAYRQTDQRQGAIDLCHCLQQSSQSHTRDWANQALTQLGPIQQDQIPNPSLES
jgi:outer membrane protein assembly factor BamD (BamD/ComL family)